MATALGQCNLVKPARADFFAPAGPSCGARTHSPSFRRALSYVDAQGAAQTARPRLDAHPSAACRRGLGATAWLLDAFNSIYQLCLCSVSPSVARTGCRRWQPPSAAASRRATHPPGLLPARPRPLHGIHICNTVAGRWQALGGGRVPPYSSSSRLSPVVRPLQPPQPLIACCTAVSITFNAPAIS